MTMKLQDDCVLFMWQCRKIYANLLLLSVLLFSLGAISRPRTGEFSGETAAWNAPAGNIEFHWSERSGAVVYRAQQITAVTAGDWELIVPEKWQDFRLASFCDVVLPENLRPRGGCFYALPTGRAPPGC